MARPDPRVRSLFAVAAVAFSAIPCAAAQESPPGSPPPVQEPAKSPAKTPAAPPKHDPAPAPEKKLQVKKCAVPGADPTGDLFLAAVDKDGRRSEFGPIAPDVAFEIWIEGMAPAKVTVQEPDPANPGQTRPVEQLKVPVSPVSIAEMDGYFANVRAVNTVGNEGMFASTLIASLLEQRAVILYYHEVLPGMKERLKRAADKIDKGMAFDKVIKQNSEDDQGKMGGGYFGNNVRGENILRYPFENIVFELEPGDVVGPIYDKWMAYLMLCDRHERGDGNRRQEQVLTRTVCSRYAANMMSQKDFSRLMTSLRVRSDKERFLRVLPPGAQVPPAKRYGPDDIAPVGKPEAPLKYRSPDEKLDNKSRTDH